MFKPLNFSLFLPNSLVVNRSVATSTPELKSDTETSFTTSKPPNVKEQQGLLKVEQI